MQRGRGPRSPSRSRSPHSRPAAAAYDLVILTLEGYDAGVCYRSQHHRTTDLTWTVIANTTDGAWPVAHAIHDTLEATASGRDQ